MKKKVMKVFDLFAGCGGLTQGFIDAGFDVIGAADNWAPALATYRLNFSHPIFDVDLADVEKASSLISTMTKPDVVIGGPPCQDFSIANNKQTRKRANLTLSFVRTALLVDVPMIVMENVYNIERYPILDRVVHLLHQSGYGVTRRVIDASRVGVPQMRKRFFLIAIKDESDDRLGKLLDDGLSHERTTVRQYLKDEIDTDFYYAHPRNYKRRAVFSLDEPAATIRRVNRPIPKNYKKHPADKCAVGPDVRPLTTFERARIQTFPKSFKFVGSLSQQEQQIGNAVPVLLARYIASALLKVDLLK